MLQRIKLFYRPTGLAGSSIQAPTQVSVALANGKLTLTNPTPFYVNFIELTQGSNVVALSMLAPFATQTIAAPKISATSPMSLSAVNDFGALTNFSAALTHGKATSLTLQSRN